MSTPQIPAQDSRFDQIFEQFWSRTVPFPFSAQATLKAKAKTAFAELVGELFTAAGNPRTVRTLVAMSKISRLLQAAKVIAADPNPDPEAVAKALEKFLEKYKPSVEEQP